MKHILTDESPKGICNTCNASSIDLCRFCHMCFSHCICSDIGDI